MDADRVRGQRGHLAAFEQRAGLLGMLHEEAAARWGRDAARHAQGRLKDDVLSMPSAAGARSQFVVKHFTGDAVVYDTQGMVEKARQTLPPDLEALLDDVLRGRAHGWQRGERRWGIAHRSAAAPPGAGQRRVGSTVLQFSAARLLPRHSQRRSSASCDA